jgi:hypothetical protein
MANTQGAQRQRTAARGEGLLRWVPWRLRSMNNLVLSAPNAFFAGVRRTPPMRVPDAADTEIHALVCHRDVNMMLTSAKSLLRYGPGLAVVLHDDGSLSADDVTALREHLPGSRIIGRHEADAAMSRVLGPEVAARRAQHFFLLKLLDVNHYARGSRVVLLDSDILFLREPEEVVAWLNDNGAPPFYNRDICPSYRASTVPEGLSLPSHLNAGFMGFRRNFEVSDIVRRCREVDYWGEDQTIYALLLANQGAVALDPERYRVYMGEPITHETRMVHFISPKRFEGLVYPRLARSVCRSLRTTAGSAAG